MKRLFCLAMVACLNLDIAAAQPQELSRYQTCLLEQIEQENGSLTVDEIKRRCGDIVTSTVDTKSSGGIQTRLERESEGHFNPFALTPHRPSYLMISRMDNANQTPYQTFSANPEPLDDLEVNYQLSVKAPLWQNMVGSGGDLYLGFTIKSWWQLFNKEVSSPFRETNYEPEIFWQKPADWSIGGWTIPAYRIGFVHQSNGRNIPLSRSWNRIYAEFVMEKGNWDLVFKPWYRIPEKNKSFDGDTSGDDNPDIWKYMGYGEYSAIYHTANNHTLRLMTRFNFNSDAKGAAELTWSFPINKRFRVYAQVFSGYGDSLIDYNESITRVSVGIALSDIIQ